MRLTILTQHYPPETGAPQNRLSDLARRLTERGHQVQVLTALPNYPGDEIHPEYLGRSGMVEEIDGVRVIRAGLYVPKKKTFLRRVANYLSFAYNARRIGKRTLEPFDVIMSESPPLFIFLAAISLTWHFKARYVANISDLWPDSVVELGMVGPGPALWAAYRLEAWMYRAASLITVQSNGIEASINERFPDKRTVLYPNGIDTAWYDGELDRAGTRQRYGWSDSDIVVGYTGILGHAQALEQVLDAARLATNPRLRFVFFGDGPRKTALCELIAAGEFDRVELLPRQRREAMPAIQAGFDIGLVPLATGATFEGVRPSKMFEMAAAGLPLMMAAAGEAARLVDECPCGEVGLVVPPERPAELAAALDRLAADPQLRQRLGETGKRWVFEYFDREQIANKIESAVESILS